MSAAGTDDIIQHRFVEIHQTSTLELEQTEKLWTILARQNLSPIAVSNACDKIVMAVKKERLRYQDTLQALQNLVLTTNQTLKSSIFLHTITQLLLFHVQDTKFHSVKFCLSTSLPGVLHPFVIILRENPDSYYDLLSEIEFCFEFAFRNLELSEMVFQVLGPFFDAVFFMSFPVDSAALLNKCTNVLMGTDEKEGFRDSALDYLLSVSRRYPTQRDMHHHLALVDTLIWAITANIELCDSMEEETRKYYATDLSYQLLMRACDAAAVGRPTLPYLERYSQLIYADGNDDSGILTNPNSYIVWGSLSYLLLVSQTVSDQVLIIKNMHMFMEISGPLFPIALIPLLQTLPEVVGSRDDLKSDILQIISEINAPDEYSFEDNEKALEDIELDISKYHITGVMANMLPYFYNFFKDGPDTQVHSIDSIPVESRLSCTYSLLFSTPHIFNTDEHVRRVYLDRISAIVSSNYGASYKFPTLLLLLHLLRHPVSTTDTILHILQSVMPSFADPADLTMTSKILQITLAIIYGQNTTIGGMQSSRETTMASVGVKTLEKIYQKQPRVWQELKKVLSDWVIRRKSITGFSRKNAPLETLQMELSVLTTMRDLCITKPRECASTILPMVISLLQSCQDLSISTLTILVQTICACIRAGIAEPRSVWNVAMKYIAVYAMENDINKTKLLYEAICDFFSIVGDKDEVSEPYIEFKTVIINDFLASLVQCNNKDVQTFALKALSHFNAVDIATLLPEKSKAYVNEITSSAWPSSGYSDVLAKLMSHELDSMLRGLFKEENTKKTASEGASKDSPNDVLVGEKERAIGSQFVMGWENARVLPGLRSGYAIAVLYAIHSHVDRQAASTVDNMTKTKWYRCMQTSIADIGLTDHLMIRISCLSAWMAIFETALVGTEADIEAKGNLLLKDLTARLERSTVPGTTCNILLAMTGLVVIAYRIIPSFAVASASQMIDTLTSKYIMKAGKSTSYSPLLMSEEVQFAARFSLGHISACVITNENGLTRLLDIFLQNVAEKTSMRSIDTSLDLIQFANGFAAGHFTGALATWATKTPVINELAQIGTESLLEYCNMGANDVSESKALGIMMGWASKIKQDDMKDIYKFAKDTLRLYIDGGSINKGVLLGATWVCAYGAFQEDQVDEESGNLLESAMEAASLDNTMSQHYFHFSTNFAKLNRLRMVVNDQESEESEAYQNILLVQVKKVQTDDPSSHERLAALFSLSSLLGVDYLNTIPDQEYVCMEAQKYNSGTRSPVLDTLAIVAGLTDGGSPVGNLKSGRIAAALCGKVVDSAVSMRETLQLKQNNISSGNIQGQLQHQTMMPIVNSSEPKSYSRLNNNTSYLRAIFDALVDVVDGLENNIDKGSVEDISLVLLRGIRETPGPLPPVNWFNLLTKLTIVSKDVWNECIMLASMHASTSMSLTEYIISQLSQDVSRFPKEIQLLLLGEAGLGMILELSGLDGHENLRTKYKRRGMDAVTKKSSVSEIRCIELVEIHARVFNKLPILGQSTFIDTMKNHLPLPAEIFDEKKTTFIENLRSVVMYNVTLPLLERTDIEKHQGLVNVLRTSIACSILDMDKLTQANSLQAWLTVDTAYEKTVGIMEMCSLKRTNATIKWITETSTRLLVLGVNHGTTWDVLAEAIQENSQSDQERLTWIVRFLDILIVIGSLELPNCSDSLKTGISYGLRYILCKVWNMEYNLDMDTKNCTLPAIFADTEYLLTFVINESGENKQGQQQIVKRMLKIIEIVERIEEKEPLKGFFVRVLRGCTKEAIGNDSQMAKLISYQ